MSSACQYQKFILEDVFMKFGEKLKLLRQQAKWTQEQAARQIGVSKIYELCKKYPKQSSLYAKIADLYNVTVDYLLTNEEQLIADAAIRGGAKAKREVQTLVSQLGGLFAGGELTENDKDKVMRAINDLYWDAKLKNKKYSSKKK